MTPIRKILLIIVVFAFVGCATPTKPNIPYSGSIPELNKIELRNPVLAAYSSEVGHLIQWKAAIHSGDSGHPVGA